MSTTPLATSVAAPLLQDLEDLPMKTDDLEPLGGLYEGRLWPLSDDDLARIEATTGWQLPDDYKSFVEAWGCSRPADGIWIIRWGADQAGVTSIEMFMGAPPQRSASVLEMAGDFLEPLGLLTVARADNGLFFMTPKGEILFERARNPELHPVADSFSEFFDKITLDE